MKHELRRVGLVTPYVWPAAHPANDYVAETAAGLTTAGVPVVVIGPSMIARSLRLTRRALRDLARGAAADEVLAVDGLQHEHDGTRFPILSVGLPLGLGPASVAVRANLRTAFEHAGIDLLYVQDPLASDLTRTAVRMWPGLTVAMFHETPPPRVLDAVTGPLRERLLDRIDMRTVGRDELRAQLAESIGGDVDAINVIPTFTTASLGGSATNPAGIVVGRGADDDALVRAVLAQLRRLLADRHEVHVTLLSRWAAHHRPATPRALRGRVHAVRAASRLEADGVLVQASLYIAFPGTPPRAIDEARAAGVPIVHISAPAGAPALATQVEQSLAGALAADAVPSLPTADEAIASLRSALDALSAKRRPPRAPGPASRERTCMIDLHMHTNHSWDCATDPEALLWAAREAGITAIAVTDHNEISGAQVCAGLADEYGVQVIVGEEVKTSQGEVIGLFLKERIEAGLTWVETLRQIRAQDGLVYVPHPFDRLHTIPDVHTLRATIDEIDAFEVYNARLAFEQYNRDAERFARKYNLIAGAGSDAHVAQGLGTAAVHIPAWDDPESFLAAMRQGEIIRKPKSFLYLQTRKFIETRTGPVNQGTAAQEIGD